jgi:hypothetical protein
LFRAGCHFKVNDKSTGWSKTYAGSQEKTTTEKVETSKTGEKHKYVVLNCMKIVKVKLFS